MDQIWRDSVQRWGLQQADFYLRDLGSSMQLLCEQPHLGRAISEVRAGYHQFPAASHTIFYRIAGESIEVIRILHQRMNSQRHL